MLDGLGKFVQESAIWITQGSVGLEAYRTGLPRGSYQAITQDLNRIGYNLDTNWEPELTRSLIRAGAEIISLETSTIPDLAKNDKERRDLSATFRQAIRQLASQLGSNFSGEHVDVFSSAFKEVPAWEVNEVLPKAANLICSVYGAEITPAELAIAIEQLTRINFFDPRHGDRISRSFGGSKPFLPAELPARYINSDNLRLIADSLASREEARQRAVFISSLKQLCTLYEATATEIPVIIEVIDKKVRPEDLIDQVSVFQANFGSRIDLELGTAEVLRLSADPRLAKLWLGDPTQPFICSSGLQTAGNLKVRARTTVLEKLESLISDPKDYADYQIEIIIRDRIAPIAKFLENRGEEVTPELLESYLERCQRFDDLFHKITDKVCKHVNVLLDRLNREITPEILDLFIDGIASLPERNRVQAFEHLIIPHLTNNPGSHNQENIKKMFTVLCGAIDARWKEHNGGYTAAITEGLGDVLSYISHDPDASKLKAFLDIIDADRAEQSCGVMRSVIRPIVLGLYGHVVAPPPERGIQLLRSFDSYRERELILKHCGKGDYPPVRGSGGGILKLPQTPTQPALTEDFIHNLGNLAWNLESSSGLGGGHSIGASHARELFTELSFVENGLSWEVLSQIGTVLERTRASTTDPNKREYVVRLGSIVHDFQELKVNSTEVISAYCSIINACSPESAGEAFGFRSRNFWRHSKKVNVEVLNGILAEVQQMDPDRVAAIVSLGFGGMLGQQDSSPRPEVIHAYSSELKAISNMFKNAEEFKLTLDGFYSSMESHFSIENLQQLRRQIERAQAGDPVSGALVKLLQKTPHFEVDDKERLSQYSPVMQRIFREPSEREYHLALRERAGSNRKEEAFNPKLLPLAPSLTFVREYVSCPENLSQPYMSCLAKVFRGKEAELSSGAIEAFSGELKKLGVLFPAREEFEKALDVLYKIGVNQTNIEGLNRFFREAAGSQQDFALNLPGRYYKGLIARLIGVPESAREKDDFDWSFLSHQNLFALADSVALIRSSEAWQVKTFWEHEHKGRRFLEAFPKMLKEHQGSLTPEFIRLTVETWMQENKPVARRA